MIQMMTVTIEQAFQEGMLKTGRLYYSDYGGRKEILDIQQAGNYGYTVYFHSGSSRVKPQHITCVKDSHLEYIEHDQPTPAEKSRMELLEADNARLRAQNDSLRKENQELKLTVKSLNKAGH